MTPGVSAAVEASPRPTSINLRKRSMALEVEFSDGETFEYSFELLRVCSPSAETRGHGEGEGKLEHGKRNVSIERLEPVGNYAVRPHFSDGHSTGIYSWPYLYRLGREKGRLWESYLRRLEEAGLGRDK